jgi:hypothetical protein
MQLVILRPTGEKLEENWNDAKKMLGNSQVTYSGTRAGEGNRGGNHSTARNCICMLD